MSDRSVTEQRQDEAFKALVRSYDDRLTALESRRTQGDIQLKSLVVNEDVAATGRLVVGDTGGIVGVIAPIVTALPAEPYDGQTIRYYVASSQRLWTLVYGGAGFEPYPWLFVGGSPLAAVVFANEATAAAGPVDLATIGPDIIAPLAGIYDVELGFFGNGSGVAAIETMSAYWMPTGVLQATAASTTIAGSAGQYTVAGFGPGLGLTPAGGTLRARYGATANALFATRWMRLTPVRVG